MSLEVNRAHFNWAASRAERAFGRRNLLGCLAWTNVAGYCAWNAHPGLYVHPDMEGVLHQIGQSLDCRTASFFGNLPECSGSGLRWLHVFTAALPVGGHTRLVERWIRNQRSISSDTHSVFATDQGMNEFPGWLKSAVEETGGFIHVLPYEINYVERALALRRAAYDRADVVVLHTNPNDPVPVVAFALPEGPPVILMNHADHVFWLGAGIADVVAEFRLVGRDLSLARRKIRQSTLLPIPLRPPAETASAEECRERLGIPRDAVVLLSIGSSYKVRPYGWHDFPHAMTEVVRRHPDVVMIVIGPSPEEPVWKRAMEETGGRIRVLGIIKEIAPYYQACDISLEGFPVGSITANLDAALVGKPVVPAPKPLLPILHMDHYRGMDETPADMEAYCSLLSRYIADAELRHARGQTLKQTVEETHTGAGWLGYLKGLVNSIPDRHEVGFGSRAESVSDNLESDAIWADLQLAHAGPCGDDLNVTRNAIRSNYRYFSRTDLLAGMFSSVAAGDMPWARTLLRDLKKVLFSKKIGASRGSS